VKRIVTCLLAFDFLVATCLAADVWTEVRSQNFILVGNAKEKKIREVASNLEQFRAAFEILLNKGPVQSSVPIVVVVFKDDKAFDPYKPVQNMKSIPLAGFYQAGEDVNYILLADASRYANPYRIIFHEFVHQMVHATIYNPPPWFNEGLAEYYSTFEVTGKGTKVLLGKPIDNHLFLLREKGLMSLESLLTIPPGAFMTHERDRQGKLYAQCWATVHFMMQGNRGARRQQFLEFLNASVQKDADFQSSFVSTFGATPKKIEEELGNYVRQQSFSYQMITLKSALDFEKEMTSRVLSDADVSYYLGDALFHCRRMTEAESYLRQALMTEPAHANARATLGIMRLHQNRKEEALKELEQAVASESVKPIAHYYYARTLYQQATRAGLLGNSNQREIAEIYEHLSKAIEQMPGYADSYNLLGILDLVGTHDLDRAIALVRKGVSLAPQRKHFLLTLARLQMRNEDFAGARESVRALLSGAVDKNLEESGLLMLEELDREERLRADWAARESQAEKPTPEQATSSREPETPISSPANPKPLRSAVEGRGVRPKAGQGAKIEPPDVSIVPKNPACAPSFAILAGLFRVAGTLVHVSPERDHVDYVILAGGTRYVFVGPPPNTPVMFSCRINLAKDLDLTDLHHSAVVYFDRVEDSVYHGRVVALEIVSLAPRP
jgi:tetratricopeptide (TPR) repeat protein